MIRFILAALSLLFYLIISIPLLPIMLLWGKISSTNTYRRDHVALAFVRSAFRSIGRISGAKVTIIGEENIPDEAVLYVGNHRSVFDIILTYPRMKRLTGFVSKDSMEHIPLFSTWMRLVKCLFLNRENMKEGLKTILQAIAYINEGISIVIFPEGTRNKGEESTLMPFKEGAVRIATKSNCPIIPMSITNTAEVFENHFPRLRPVNVVIEYGKPIYPSELTAEDKKQLGTYVSTIIQETITMNQLKHL